MLLQRDKKKLQKKRKAGEGDDTTGGDAGAESGGGAGATASTSALPAAKPKRAKPAARNTAVYVTGLPRDATAAEVSGVFSKAGLILLDAEGQPKIKLYTDSGTGVRNGDGLVVYYNEGSVTLAQELLDDTPLRLGDEQNRMKVAKADWGHKTTPANGADAQDGDNGQQKKRKGKMTNEEAKKMQRRAERLQKEAADYDPSYDEKDAPEALTAVVPAATSASASGGSAAGAGAAKAKAAGGRVVVLAHVFTLQELAEDASLLLDLKEDVREECEGLGKVTNLVLYDVSPLGKQAARHTSDAFPNFSPPHPERGKRHRHCQVRGSHQRTSLRSQEQRPLLWRTAAQSMALRRQDAVSEVWEERGGRSERRGDGGRGGKAPACRIWQVAGRRRVTVLGESCNSR